MHRKRVFGAVTRGRWETGFAACVATALALAATPCATTPRDAPGGEGVEAAVIAEHNLARTNPRRYARYLEEWRPYFRGRRLELPGRGVIMTEEGDEALEEAIAFLLAADPLPKLRSSSGLARAARDHVRDCGPDGIMGHVGNDGSEPPDRVRRYGKWSGRVGENIAYGGKDAREFVIRLIVDDGIADRAHRANIFDPHYRFAGVAFGRHRTYGTMCVITYAAAFDEHGD